MPTFTEVLMPTKSSKHPALTWTPAEGGPDAGTLTIDTDRSRVCYTVTEFPTSWGRGFHLAKQTTGTDAEAESYDVLCANPQDRLCDCKGFQRWGRSCKHLDAVFALLANGWL